MVAENKSFGRQLLHYQYKAEMLDDELVEAVNEIIQQIRAGGFDIEKFREGLASDFLEVPTDKVTLDNVLDWQSNTTRPTEDILNILVDILIKANPKILDKEAAEQSFRKAHAIKTSGKAENNFGRQLLLHCASLDLTPAQLTAKLDEESAPAKWRNKVIGDLPESFTINSLHDLMSNETQPTRVMTLVIISALNKGEEPNLTKEETEGLLMASSRVFALPTIDNDAILFTKFHKLKIEIGGVINRFDFSTVLTRQNDDPLRPLTIKHYDKVKKEHARGSEKTALSQAIKVLTDLDRKETKPGASWAWNFVIENFVAILDELENQPAEAKAALPRLGDLLKELGNTIEALNKSLGSTKIPERYSYANMRAQIEAGASRAAA